MSDLSNSDSPGASGPGGAAENLAPGNLAEYSVSEISQAVKRSLEDRFARVRVRGEISGFKKAASGHLYMALKDEGAVLDGVCWRGVAGRLPIKPEDGMEVIASGRISSYPGRSKYQLIIDSMELAGEGALLKLLEERKKKLAAEGLFAEERKRPLPFLPEVIGVVTSPTGAVIRDILHRLADRFPRRVLVWPVLVQGEGAAGQVAAAIEGFNALPAEGKVPRPDLLIVARGGGSLEDLWAFNEEVVARAAAASEIPLISAVGHETDTTLIDYVSDRRAPTPTAAAEIAVPLRRELLATLLDLERRTTQGLGRLLDERRNQVEGLSRGLPDPRRLLEVASQRLDERAERLSLAVKAFFQARAAEAGRLAAALPHPRQQLRFACSQLAEQGGRMTALAGRLPEAAARDLTGLDAERRLARALARALKDARGRLDAAGQVLESLSYAQVLKRGYAVVHGPGGLIMRAAGVAEGAALAIEFADGKISATAGEGVAPPPRKPAKAKGKPAGENQGRLL